MDIQTLREAVDDHASIMAMNAFRRAIHPIRHSKESFGLYFIACEDLVKIGKAKDPLDRVRTLQIGCPMRLNVVAFFKHKGYMEADLHKRFRHLHVTGEWFRFTDEIQAVIEEISKCSI